MYGVQSSEYIYLEPPFSRVIYIPLSFSFSLSLCVFCESLLSLSLKQERKKEKVGIEIGDWVNGDGDDLIVADPRSSPVWLNAKIGRFLVKVELYLTDMIY